MTYLCYCEHLPVPVVMDNNHSRKIVYSLGDELETFIDSLDDVKNSVYIAYHAKRRYYGAKVLVTVRNRSSYSTVLHVVSKIRSESDIPMFCALLQGIKDAVYKYVESTRHSDSSD